MTSLVKMKYNENYCYGSSAENDYDPDNVLYSGGYVDDESLTTDSTSPRSRKRPKTSSFDYDCDDSSSGETDEYYDADENDDTDNTNNRPSNNGNHKRSGERSSSYSAYTKDPLYRSKNTTPTTYDFDQITVDFHSDNPHVREDAQLKTLMAMEGIIMSIIKKHYYSYAPKYFEDMKSSARIGVLLAIDKYDPHQAAASTYYYPHIIHHIQKYIDKFVNKTSTHYASNVRKIKKVMNDFVNQNKPYTTADIAHVSGLTMETIEQSLAIINYTNNVHFDNCSEGFINKNSKSKRELDPEIAVEDKQANEAIYTAMDESLDPNEKAIIMMAIGFGDALPASFKEISKTLGIPMDKVRKLYNEALRKLRASKRLHGAFCDHFEQEEAVLQNADLTFFNFDMPLNESEAIANAIDIDF